jgi:pimeloyl-ACP methyl ester carboxylesterase
MGATTSLFVQEPSGAGKPWVILIHGLGMSDRSWIAPFSETLLDGTLSFDYVLTDHQSLSPVATFPRLKKLGCSPPLRISKNPPCSIGEVLKNEGYGILTWSQGKPRGPVIHAVEELQTILEPIPRRDKKILMGHSRGGLIARKYLQEHRPGWDQISGVILLGVPNHGSQIAKWAGNFSQNLLSRFFAAGSGGKSRILQKNDYGSLTGLIRSLVGYSRHEGIEELAPRSGFMKELASGEREEGGNKIPYFNLIGMRTEFIRFYRLTPLSVSRPKPLFSLLDGLEKIFPRSLIPPEIQRGRGDGQVSVESAVLPWAESNQLLPINHAEFLVNVGVQERVKKFLEEI